MEKRPERIRTKLLRGRLEEWLLKETEEEKVTRLAFNDDWFVSEMKQWTSLYGGEE